MSTISTYYTNVQYIRSFHLIKTDLTLAYGRSIVNSPKLPSYMYVLIKNNKIINTAYTASLKNPNKIDSLRHSRNMAAPFCRTWYIVFKVLQYFPFTFTQGFDLSLTTILFCGFVCRFSTTFFVSNYLMASTFCSK